MGLSRWEGLNNWGHTEDTPSMITPPNETDSVKNAVPSKWTKGACPPVWQPQTILLFSGEALQFSDGTVLSFKDY